MLGWMATAMRAEDYKGMRGACESLGEVGRRFADMLPGPESEPKLSAMVKGASDDIAEAVKHCQTFGPGTSQADLDEFLSHMNDAMNHFSG